MKTKLKSLAPIVACFAAASLVWYWSLTRRHVNEADLESLSGTLRVAEEKSSFDDPYLEFYLTESHLRFCIPVGRYATFDRTSFFQNVQPGDTIVVRVEKAQLANPSRTMTDQIETVFVEELKDAEMTYYSLAAGRHWVEQNQLFGAIGAIILSAFTFVLIIDRVRSRPRQGGLPSSSR